MISFCVGFCIDAYPAALKGGQIPRSVEQGNKHVEGMRDASRRLGSVRCSKSSTSGLHTYV